MVYNFLQATVYVGTDFVYTGRVGLVYSATPVDYYTGVSILGQV